MPRTIMTAIQIAFVLFTWQFLFTQCTKVRVCENEVLSISCPNDAVINVLNAVYGRLSSDLCNQTTTSIANNTCKSENSLLVVREKCEEKNSCNISADNDNFYNPCYGIFKYLEVHYVCVNLAITKQSCENENLNIICPFGTVIKIQNATFGRLDEMACNKSGNVLNTNCNSKYSLEVAYDRCEGLPSCTLNASAQQFYGDNPCNGTSKYLEISYMCIFEPIQCGENEMIAPVLAFNRVVTFGCVCKPGYKSLPMDGSCVQDQ